jgi:hypothetical protein
MKKSFFLFAMLISISAFTQNIKVESISATYTGAPTVKFRVSWTGARTYRHNTKVWVFVDYQKVEGSAPSGTWTRAAVASTPTVSSAPASTATLVNGNNKGFWLNGVDGNYSATVTVPLSNVPAKFRWCAYATDYPPNVVILGNNSYTLHGSRPFVINGTTLPANQTTYTGTITSFTDATGAPGIFPAALGEKTNEMGCVAGFVENISGVCITPESIGCNNNALNFGTVAFTAGTTITVVGNGVSQIWSRPVTATGCQKTTFNGGSSVTQSYNVDCRSNPSYSGDLFSFCATFRHAEKLCPPPWRVPSARDFRMLLDAFGLINGAANQQQLITTKMVGVWAAEWNGSIYIDGTLYEQNATSFYAALSTMDALRPVGRLRVYNNKWGTSSWYADVVWHTPPYLGGDTMRCVQ